MCTHGELRRRRKSCEATWIDPLKQVFYTPDRRKWEFRWLGNVHAHRHVKLYEVKGNHSTTVPGQHSNDRLSVPAQNWKARNSVHQCHCLEYS